MLGIAVKRHENLAQGARWTPLLIVQMHDISCSHSHVIFGVNCLHTILTLKGRLPGKVHQALCEKIMKPSTSQDTK
jgi:hypothetical protein